MSNATCDKWILLKILEFLMCVACVVCKRITDDETTRVHLILQRLSREWSLLRNVTWGRVGTALGDATYGGYVIITAGLLIGRLIGEIPQGKRIMEFFLLGLGTILFVLLASLELFGVDDLPDNLIDNAIVLGTLSMFTALLFLIDLAGPRKSKSMKKAESQKQTHQTQPQPVRPKPVLKPQVLPTSPEPNKREETRPKLLETTFPATVETEIITEWEPYRNRSPSIKQSRSIQTQANGISNGIHSNGIQPNGIHPNGIQKLQSLSTVPSVPPDPPAWMTSSHPQTITTVPLKIETNNLHSPIWSKLRSQPYKQQGDTLSPVKKSQTTSFLLPMPPFNEQRDNSSPETTQSSPIDPGYVQYTVEKWGQKVENTKTPRHSPTEV